MTLVAESCVQDVRELLRQFRTPFALYAYDATVEDYLAIADEDLKCEFLDGELIVHSPATWHHEDMGGFVLMLLRDFVSRHRLGYVCGPNAVMELAANRYFSPDVSYLSYAHEARLQNERIVGPVDLAVEILSKSTRRYDCGDKLAAYQAGRVPEIWHIDSDESRFVAYVLRGDAYERTELAAGRWSSTVVPGFSLDVAWLWRRPLPSLDECR